MEIVFSEFRNRFLLFFGGLGSGFSGFLGLENELDNEVILVKNRILRSGSGDADLAEIWAL